MSPEARAKIAAAQKARWAKLRGGGSGSSPSSPTGARRGRPPGSGKKKIGGMSPAGSNSGMIETMSLEDLVAAKQAIERRLENMRKLLDSAGVN